MPCVTAVRRCSGVTTFSQEVFHDLQIERLVRDEPLELPILFLERLEALGLGPLQPAVLLLPAIERLLRHAVPPHEVRHLGAGVPLLEHGDDLLIRKPTLPHSPLGGGLTLSLDQLSGSRHTPLEHAVRARR